MRQTSLACLYNSTPEILPANMEYCLLIAGSYWWYVGLGSSNMAQTTRGRF